MVLTAAQAAHKRRPMGLMIGLWLAGCMLRVLALSVWPSFDMGNATGSADGEDIARQLASLHTDNHISVYTLVIFAAQVFGANITLLRASSLVCDIAQAFLWLWWLGPREPKAANIYLALWAASPPLLQTATAPGPHAALGLWTSIGFMALWPVWQQQRPSRSAELWLLVSWALLVAAHPLGVLAVAAMVLVAVAWPKASAQALSNSLNTTVGQAGGLALKIGQPALMAGIVYLGMRALGHIYPSAEPATGPAHLSVAYVLHIFAASFGTDKAISFGPWAVAWPMPEVSGALCWAFLILAGLSHPTGQKLICTAILYGAGLAAYHSQVPVFAGPTLVPAWILLLAGGAMGLGQPSTERFVRAGVAALCLWQLYLCLRACPLLKLPF